MSKRNSGSGHVTMSVPDDYVDDASRGNSSGNSLGSLKEGEVACMKCHNKPATFETDPCHHLCFCKTCAMKCASGGKCKICSQMYGGLRHRN